MPKTEETTEAKVEAVEIVRGRMPVAMVYAIRFKEEGSDGELARKYRTTPGKINDIKKNRNFGYVTEKARFTREQLDAALERAGKLGEDDVESVNAVINGMSEATEDDVTALEAARASTRKPRGKSEESPETEGEGGDPETEGEGGNEPKGEESEDEDLDSLLE